MTTDKQERICGESDPDLPEFKGGDRQLDKWVDNVVERLEAMRMTAKKIVVSVDNGKYTIEIEERTGKMTALRHGEPWGRDLVGDKLVYNLTYELYEARKEIESLRAQLAAPDAQAPAAFPERDQSKPAEQQGLFAKFRVQRVDGSDQQGGKHHGCRYFVLDLDHDKHAPATMRAYAADCKATHQQLAADIEAEFGAAPADEVRLKLITAVQSHLVDVVRSFGDVSCAMYISTWHKAEVIDAAMRKKECSKCGDVLPEGRYCKGVGCPLNPALCDKGPQNA